MSALYPTRSTFGGVRHTCHLVTMGNNRAIGFAVILSFVLLGCGGESRGAGIAGAGGTGAGGTSGTSGSPGTGGSGGTTMNGAGLSVAYPGDVGMDAHPSVIFYEDFEDPNVDTMGEGWDNVTRGDTMLLTGDVPAAAVGGSQALQMLVPGGQRSDRSHLV